LARAKRADQIFVIVGKEEHQAKTARIYHRKPESTELDFKNFKYTELAPQNHVKMDGTELEIFVFRHLAELCDVPTKVTNVGASWFGEGGASWLREV